MASMDIPYKPGVLEGVVYKDGAKISRSTLVTPKEAAVLELVPEEESFVADGKDLSYVRVTLKDADGNGGMIWRISWRQTGITAR